MSAAPRPPQWVGVSFEADSGLSGEKFAGGAESRHSCELEQM